MPYIRCILLLIAFLHTRHHVSFRACALILITLNFLFSKIPGDLLDGQDIPRSLTTIFSRLELSDKFKVHPICYLCHRIFDFDNIHNLCPDCQEGLYRPATQHLFQRLFDPEQLGDEHDNLAFNFERTPHLVAPIHVLSVGLREFFGRPGMIPAVNAWKKRPTVPGELNSMQDAQVWQTIKGPDETSFFFGNNADKEIRLGVTLSLDW